MLTGPSAFSVIFFNFLKQKVIQISVAPLTATEIRLNDPFLAFFGVFPVLKLWNKRMVYQGCSSSFLC